jgi:hypothetical protein
MLRLILLLVASLSIASCELVGGIFKAGVVGGVILVVLVLGVLFWVFGRFRRPRG